MKELTHSASLFEGKTWLIYGRIALPKQEAIEAITSRGGRVVTSVSSKLDFLVWDGETLLPTENASAVKVSELLNLGGLAVGDADFARALKGELSEKIRGHLEARAGVVAAPAPKPSKPKKSAVAAERLTPQMLVERVKPVLGSVSRLEPWLVVMEVIELCNEKKALDVAADLAAAMPTPYRELAQARVAITKADASTLEALVSPLLEAYASADPSDKEALSNQLLRLGILAAPLTSRATELQAPARAMIDEGLAYGRAWPISEALGALFDWGYFDEVRTLLRRAYGPASRMFPQLSLRRGEIAVFADDPDFAMTLIEALGAHEQQTAIDHPSVAAVFSVWPIEVLERLAAPLPQGVVTRLGEALIARGRTSEARRLFGDGEGLLVETRVARHHLLGEHEAVRALLSGEPPTQGAWETLGIQHGIETPEEALARMEARRGPSVMNDVKQRVVLGNLVLEREDTTALSAILASCETLLAQPERTPHDRGLEAEIRGAVDTLWVQYLMKSQGEVRALLERQLEALPALQQLAHTNQQDPGMRTFSKNNVASDFVRRAGRAGHVDLAIKGAKKLSASDRAGFASSVARYFLPADPHGALEAFDALGGKPAQLLARGSTLMVELMRTVLNQP